MSVNYESAQHMADKLWSESGAFGVLEGGMGELLVVLGRQLTESLLFTAFAILQSAKSTACWIQEPDLGHVHGNETNTSPSRWI